MDRPDPSAGTGGHERPEQQQEAAAPTQAGHGEAVRARSGFVFKSHNRSNVNNGKDSRSKWQDNNGYTTAAAERRHRSRLDRSSRSRGKH